MADTKAEAGSDDLGLAPGATLLGKYRLERLLGRGGMGVVWLAHHLRLDEDVALKFLLPAARAKPDVVARFEREARAIVKLKSPHVARMLDVEVMPSGPSVQEPVPFIVMEYLDGQTLAGLVRGHAALPVELVAEYTLQACEAVAEAHALGIVHRDLKPANLFLTSGADGSPVVKVLDFGVSKMGALETTSSDVETQPDALVGSPPYMSPEQLRSSKNVDARTDIWSLGVCLYELATGHMPFAAQNLHEHYTKLMLEPPPVPSATRADLPPELDAIVARCLQREPAERYPSVAELARDLAKLAPEGARAADRIERTLAAVRPSRPSRSSGPSLPAPPITLPPSLHSGSVADRTELTGRSRKRRDLRVLFVAALLALVGVVTFIVSRVGTNASTNTSTNPSKSTSANAAATSPGPPVLASIASAGATPLSLPLPEAEAGAATPLATHRSILHRPPTVTSANVDLEHRK